MSVGDASGGLSESGLAPGASLARAGPGACLGLVWSREPVLSQRYCCQQASAPGIRIFT